MATQQLCAGSRGPDAKPKNQPDAGSSLRHRPYEDIQALLTGTLFMAFGVVLCAHAELLTGGTPGLFDPLCKRLELWTGFVFGERALLCAGLGGFNVLALFLQARFGWRAGRVQMVMDGVILLGSFAVIDLQHVALSVLGAFMLNQTLATDHRAERYVAL